jgi:hypothetical protein
MEGVDRRTDGELLIATASDPQAFAFFYRRHVHGVLRDRPAPAERPTRSELSFGRIVARDDHDTLMTALFRRLRVHLRPGETRLVELIALHSAAHGDLLSVSNFARTRAGHIAPPILVDGPFTTQSIAARGLTVLISQNAVTGSQVVAVVPDGVSRVTFSVPGQPSISSPVSDNVAGFHVPGRRFVADPTDVTATWYGSSGTVIRRIPGA